MEAAGSLITHPRGAELHPGPGREERRVGWLFAGAGLALFAVMGLLGLAMRLTQAETLDISAEWFYRLMTLHGAGMLVGALMAMMGGLWFVVRAFAPLDHRRMMFTFAAILVGAVGVVVSVVLGGFATGWTFLSPLPFLSADAWSTWATVVFLGGLAAVGIGFFVFCIDVLAATTRTYGGFAGATGISFLRGRGEAPPPQVIGATIVSTQGLMAVTVGTTIIFALLGRAIDADVAIDALWAKNLTFFFGHSLANLIIYLGAGMIYVLLPRYAGRPWASTKPVVYAWLATLLLVSTAYFHHLYLDFVQPGAAQVIGTVASSAAAVPVAVVTIYGGMMLVWGSRFRWTLTSVLIYLGFVGWAIGGAGAVIDSVIPINFRFHNSLWVPAHFHTYLMMGVVMWAMAFVTHLLERAAGRVASRSATLLSPVAMVIGGYGLVATWYASGALGVPRRFAVHPPGTDEYSLVGSAFVVIFALGFAGLLVELLALGRDAWRRRGAGGSTTLARIAGAAPEADQLPLRPPLTTPAGIAFAVAAATAALFVFLPEIEEASEASAQFHHLAHSAQFLLGVALGAALISTPHVFATVRGRWSNLGLAAVILAPAAMLLLMIPSIYVPLEEDEVAHAAYHVGLVMLGGVAGFGAGLLGRVPGRLLIFLAIAMPLMYAGGVSGG